MPIIRKLVQIGNAKGVTLPKSWLKYWEKKQGESIKGLAIEVNEEIKIKPYFEEKDREEGDRNG